MKNILATITIIIISLTLVTISALLHERRWNDGNCFKCKNVEWQFDRVSENGISTLWHCPSCYTVFEKY